MLEQLVNKPFEKENELAQLRKDVANFEKEITIKIQKSQLLKEGVEELPKATQIVKMETTLLAKIVIKEKNTKGMKV
jgi:hypothetical protein